MARQTGLPLSKQEPRAKYYLTTFAGTNEYDTIDEVLFFIRNNHLESFCVSCGDTDLTSMIITILNR